MQHSSVIGGSTAGRRLNCPASYGLEAKAPKQRGSSYAQEGTALHEIIAQRMAFRYKDGPPVSLDEDYIHAEDDWKYELSSSVLHEEIGNAEFMFDNFVEMLESQTRSVFEVLGIEVTLPFPLNGETNVGEAFGTSDLVFVCGDTFGIVDWKFGRRPVSPEQSSQLLYYACCAYEKYKTELADKNIKHVSLNIAQPRTDDAIKEWRTDLPDLEAFKEEVNEAVREMVSPNPHMESGKWCQFASCRSICPLHMNAVGEVAVRASDLHAPGVKENPDAFLAASLPIAETAERWVAAIRDAAQAHVENGGLIDGYEMVEKRSSGRVWNPDVTEAQRVGKLRRLGLKAEDYTDRTFKSPPKVEKILKDQKKKLPDDLAVLKPSSGFVLKRTTKTEAIDTFDREGALKLGAKLHSMMEKSHD